MQEMYWMWLMTAVATMGALGGLIVAKRTVSVRHLRRHQEFVDSMLNVVGMLISILLGLLVAGALDRYEQIDAKVNNEAHSVAQVYRLSAGLPQSLRDTVRAKCKRYNALVLNDEWEKMKNDQMSEDAWQQFSSLEHELIVFHPSNDGESNVQNALLAAVVGIGEGRRDRTQVLMSRRGFLPLVVGIFSAIVISFTFLYATRGIVLHGVLVAFVSICLSFNVCMLYLLTTPFKTGEMIAPSGFKINERMFERLPQEEMAK